MEIRPAIASTTFAPLSVRRESGLTIEKEDLMKALVAYYSESGNTEKKVTVMGTFGCRG